MSYLAEARLWTALPEAIITFTVNATSSTMLWHAGSQWRRPFSAAAAWGAALLAARLVGGHSTIGALLSVTYAVQLAPAVWTAFRDATPTGIATATGTAPSGRLHLGDRLVRRTPMRV
jgi:hypothetical protein